MIKLFCGDNTYRIQREVETIKTDFIRRHGQMGVSVQDAEDVEPHQLADLVAGNSLFSEAKLVILRDLSANKQLADALASMLELIPDDTVFIIIDYNPDKRQKWYKQLKQAKAVETHDALKPHQLYSWVSEQVRAAGATISAGDARLLVERVGTDQARLSSEIDKLTTHSSKVTRQTIELLVEASPQETIFQLLDAVMAGEVERARQLYHRQSQIDLDPHQFIAMLAWQLHGMVLAKLNQDLTAYELATKAKMAPFVAGKLIKLVKRMSINQIQRALEVVIEADAKTKTTGSDAYRVAELCIDKLARAISS